MFRFLEVFTEIAGWLLIAASPTLIGLGVGGFVFLAIPTSSGLYMGIALAISGLIMGIIWATRIYKKHGTIRFLSRLSGTPELDEKPKDENNNASRL